MPSSPSRTPLLVTPQFQPQYSPLTGLVYVFNVIVGTGALALPHVVNTSGYLLSSFLLILLAFISYVTVTFVIESMSISNALMGRRKRDEDRENSLNVNSGDGEDENEALIDGQSDDNANLELNFEINNRVEMGTMAGLYFSPTGQALFYLCIVVYLYGDLSIYITAVAKSLRDVSCRNVTTNNITSNFCETQYTTETSIYRLYTILFMLFLAPFAFLNVTKTKYLQMATTIFRWSAFLSMIAISTGKIGSRKTPAVVADFNQLPRLFGVSIYSFMCHHSLPSLVTPITSKTSLKSLFFIDYGLITVFYILLSVTGVFAFDTIKDLYTLNFIDDSFLGYFLALFPVFTLSTNFPIIAITLRNNLASLFNAQSVTVVTFLAILPPFFVSFFIEDVHFLVNFTGAFAGAGIQYFIPCVIVFLARKQVSPSGNYFKSWFFDVKWIYAVFAFAVSGVGMVVVDLFFR